ncbi:MAG TPA: aminomethyltransferase family protein, partial [Burkholderiales bacterium]|nr:aminomethyltransferase family protein [Burkholderiales bacterium]
MVQLASKFSAYLSARSAAVLTAASGVVMPEYFSGPASEHLVTRRAAGLFDFSFMYCVEVAGPDSTAFLRALQSRAIDAIAHGRIAYTLLLREDGTIFIDATVWRHDDERYWLFTGRRGDAGYIAQAARPYAVTLTDRSTVQAVMAIQGTSSTLIVERVLSGIDIRSLRYFGFIQTVFAGVDCWVARIGYSGEHGYELVIADAIASHLWAALLEAGEPEGLRECGFAAMDSLRIEAGHILFSHELAQSVTPAEAGLARLVDWRNSIATRAQGRTPARQLVGLLPDCSASAANTATFRKNDGTAIITSRAWSPLLEHELALGFVPCDCACAGVRVRV